LRSTCYSPWRPAVNGLLLSAWIVNPMAMCHNLAAPETTIDAIGKWGCCCCCCCCRSHQARLCRLYVKLVWRKARSGRWVACVRVRTPETPYYRSSSHTMWMKMPLGANERSQGADAPRDLVCPNRLSVAREREYSR
jgi:hypothetical protein